MPWNPNAGKKLDSSDDGADIAQEGSAFPQALLDVDVSHGHDVDNQSVSSAECPDMHDDFDGFDGLDLRPAEMHGSSDTEAWSYRTGSDNGDVGHAARELFQPWGEQPL